MESEVVVQQCLTCKVGNEHPEWLAAINQWMGEGKTFDWIAEKAKAAWEIELNVRSLKRHYESGHLPDRYRLTREAMEQALGNKYFHMHANSLAALNLMVATWKDGEIAKIARGEESSITANVAIQAIKELTALTADKPTCERITVNDETYVNLVKAAMDCIPPVKQLEFGAYFHKVLAPELIAQIEQHPEYRAFHEEDSKPDEEDQ